MVRPVLIYGDKTLRRKSVAVDLEPGVLGPLVRDLFDTMYDEPGIGLAAPQVGALVRVVVVASVADDDDGHNVGKPLALLNPEILSQSEDFVPFEEGCLSVPGITETVERPRAIRLRYASADGEIHERDAAGLLARVVQHEVDHLDGILFVDRLPLVKRQLLRKRLQNLSSTRARTG